jgi:hypothetical protein
MWKEAVPPNFKQCTGICLRGGLRKTHSQDSLCLCRDSNRQLPDYKPET